ncbi:MAG: polysaccharide biosynthesis/export family protein [Bacteroidia bacterium]|nr:polysaccharide biosynthesis/export family protein [Bacteroidia bacterium]
MLSSVEQTAATDSALIYQLSPLLDYKFRQNDQLFIKVNAYEGNTKDLFDGNESDGGGLNSQALYFTSFNYLIDKEGNIELPLIGKEKVVGRTSEEVKRSLDEKLKAYLPNASTIVRLSSFKITILGEVQAPGVHEIFSDRISILQAFGLSGGMTDYADLEHVKLVRETEDGRIGSIYLDLTKSDIHKSEFYFLRPGDVIYIEPLKAKAMATSTQSLSIVFQSLSFLTVVLNTAAVILNIRNQNQNTD